MTDHELTLLLTVCGLAIIVGGIGLAGWPAFLHHRRRPRGWKDIP